MQSSLIHRLSLPSRLDTADVGCRYGIRAGAKRQGRKDATRLNSEPVLLSNGTYSHLYVLLDWKSCADLCDRQEDYIPPSTPMEMSLVLTELLEYAVKLLKPGGRLVRLRHCTLSES